MPSADSSSVPPADRPQLPANRPQLPADRPQYSAIVLCGGLSTRMGVDKFSLPFGDTTFLGAVLNSLSATISGSMTVLTHRSHVAQVETICQRTGLDNLTVLVDRAPDSGPLEGIGTGLSWLVEHQEQGWAFVTCCDVPKLKPAIVGKLLDSVATESLADVDAVMPIRGARIFGMTSLYRIAPHVSQIVDQQIDAGELRVSDVSKKLNTHLVPVDQLESIDPQLDSLMNLNHPQQYLDFLEGEGLTCEPTLLRRLTPNRS